MRSVLVRLLHAVSEIVVMPCALLRCGTRPFDYCQLAAKKSRLHSLGKLRNSGLESFVTQGSQACRFWQASTSDTSERGNCWYVARIDPAMHWIHAAASPGER
eukprot:1633857-Prymnesium_polylepis.1